MEIPPELQSMLDAEHGPTKQKAARLVVDLAASAGASEFTRCAHAHVSGVSVITGGHGLRRFLSDLSGDSEGVVSIPTTARRRFLSDAAAPAVSIKRVAPTVAVAEITRLIDRIRLIICPSLYLMPQGNGAHSLNACQILTLPFLHP